MIWQIIFLFIIFLLIIPIPINFKGVFHILRLSGSLHIQVFKIINFKIRVRFRGAYVYITRNNHTTREKLTATNYNVAFVMQLIKQVYFRIHLKQLNFISDIGYYNDALCTAMISSMMDIISKCLYARILHNKKSAHIFISNEPKYNKDCLNIKVESKLYITLFDMLYSLVNTVWSLKGEKYEKSNSNLE